ncbi:MAG TPA: hypothetical protein VKE70_18790 [Candidatus Solibacter sp.]|nr:hypothetical protein [Candidatus Solibacter sp.]
MPSESLRALLTHLIDYAGLFPPASLDLQTAMRNYAAYREGEYAWMLGRFVVPAARKGELDAAWPLAVLESAPRKMEVAGDAMYYEIPLDADPASLGARAKIRLGGESYPEPPPVADFLRRCAAARVSFKATAGLHHPLRNPPMHGFVNLFLAAALAWRGEDPLSTLEETSFAFDDDAVRWRKHTVTVAELRNVREQFAISFGSCSFEEPIDDLKALGWL